MPSSEPREARQRLTGLVIGMFVLLALQNLAGTWINLYVRVTDTSSYGGVYPAMFGSLAGSVHTVVGVLIGLNAILLLAMALRVPDRRLSALAAIVLGFVGIAAYAGFHFVVSGGDDAYSFVMEASFIAIVLAEAGILAWARGPALPGPTPAIAPARSPP